MFLSAIAAAAIAAGPVDASCDPSGANAAIEATEDRAFAALKAANEAVAKAARTGTVGDAGDAELRTYKTLRAEAERLRMESAKACYAALAAASPPPAVAPSPVQPAPSASPLESEPRQRFAVSLSGGLRDIQAKAISRYVRNVETGTVNEYFLPVSQANSPVSTSNFSGSLTETGDAPAKSVKAWGSSVDLAFSFAPEGQGEAGWLWTLDLGYRDLQTKSLTNYLGGVALTGPSVLKPNYGSGPFFNVINSYHRTTPAVRVDYGTIGSLSPVLSIEGNLVTQDDQSYDLTLGVARRFLTPSPVGELGITMGGSVTGSWRSLTEKEGVSGRQYFSIPFVMAYRRTARGFGVGAEVNGGLDGPLPEVAGVDLRWTVFGGAGLQASDLTATSSATSSTTQYSQTAFLSDATYYGGAGVIASVTPQISLRLDLLHRRELYLTSNVSAPSTAAEASMIFGDGSSFTLRPVYATEIRGGVNYAF